MSAALEVGDVVISKAGHDRGNLFVVLESIDSEYVRIADGRTRTLEKPKKKKRRHLKAVAEAERTAKVSWQNNAEIRTAKAETP